MYLQRELRLCGISIARCLTLCAGLALSFAKALGEARPAVKVRGLAERAETIGLSLSKFSELGAPAGFQMIGWYRLIYNFGPDGQEWIHCLKPS